MALAIRLTPRGCGPRAGVINLRAPVVVIAVPGVLVRAAGSATPRVVCRPAALLVTGAVAETPARRQLAVARVGPDRAAAAGLGWVDERPAGLARFLRVSHT